MKYRVLRSALAVFFLLCFSSSLYAGSVPNNNDFVGEFGNPTIIGQTLGSGVKKGSLVDQGDYYFLNTGKKASFLRKKNTYLIIVDEQEKDAQELQTTIQSQFANSLDIIKDHSLGKNIMVLVKEGEDASDIVSALFQTDSSIDFISPVLTSTTRGGELAVNPQLVVSIKSGENPDAVIALLQDRYNLSLVSRLSFTNTEFKLEIEEPISDISRIFELTREIAELPSINWVEPNFLVSPTKYFTPNDTLFNDQWHLHNTGQNGGAVDADIDAPEGWDISKGDNTVIAVYDDGVDIAHEDLVIWSNPGETGGGKESNGIDDDGNGYIDDYQGWDFGDGDNDPSPALITDNHGTAVAGVAGARGNNSQGVTGSAVNAAILPVRSAAMSCADFGNAMRYAAKYADVVNNSWGIGACESEINAAISDAVNGNIAGARRGTLGTPVLFATGNSASGWRKFTLTGFPAGTYDFRWKFLKDSTVSMGYDTVWLDDINWPGGTSTDFESDTPGGLPSGFTGGGSAQWSVVSDGTHARGASGNSVKAGTITHSQETYLDATKAVGSGDLTFWVWVSCESPDDNNNIWDYFELSVNGTPYFQYCPGQYGTHDNGVGYPASNSDTIAVGASTDGAPGGVEERSGYSQFGTEVDVVAPSNGGGQGITTTDRMGAEGYDPSNYTSTFGGTSSATPLTAGVVADLISYDPTLTEAEVRQVLRDGCDEIGPYAYSGGRNDYYGHGRVNLVNSLNLLTGGGGCADADGDVNQDGSITPQDALMTFQHYLGMIILDECQQSHAEVTEDGSITPADALCIFQFYLGLPSCLDVVCTDADGDGYSIEGGECGTIDCDDNDASINPGAAEVCDDVVDNDCDGYTDAADPDCVTCTDVDGDGYSIEGGECGTIDCDDNNASINPGAAEVCDELDNNCDGQIDEGVNNTYYHDADGDGYGDPNDSIQACSVPPGYVSNNYDCDDTDPSKHDNCCPDSGTWSGTTSQGKHIEFKVSNCKITYIEITLDIDGIYCYGSVTITASGSIPIGEDNEVCIGIDAGDILVDLCFDFDSSTTCSGDFQFLDLYCLDSYTGTFTADR